MTNRNKNKFRPNARKNGVKASERGRALSFGICVAEKSDKISIA